MKVGTRLIAALLAGGLAGPLAAAEPINPSALYPEGPLWLDGALYYAEMTADRVTRWDGTENHTFWRGEGCGPTSIAPLTADRLLVLCHISAELVILDRDGQALQVIDRDDSGRRLTSPNDVIADGRGGAYFSEAGVFWREAPATGRVYYLNAAGSLQTVAAGLHYANGLVLDRAGARLFFSEHLARKVWLFPVEPNGSLAPGRPFFDLGQVAEPPRHRDAHAGPDGLDLDRAGNLYICEYGAGRVLLVGPDGRLRGTLQVPLPYLTNIALAPDEGELFLTAAKTNRARPFPGAVFRVENPLK